MPGRRHLARYDATHVVVERDPVDGDATAGPAARPAGGGTRLERAAVGDVLATDDEPDRAGGAELRVTGELPPDVPGPGQVRQPGRAAGAGRQAPAARPADGARGGEGPRRPVAEAVHSQARAHDDRCVVVGVRGD